MCKKVFKQKSQTLTFPAQFDYFEIKLRKLGSLRRYWKLGFCFDIDYIGSYQIGWLAGIIFPFSNLNFFMSKPFWEASSLTTFL